MMTQKTTDNINKLAKLLIDAFIQDAKMGFTTRNDIDQVKKITSTEIELIKKAISIDKNRIKTAVKYFGWSGNLDNIMKRSEHFNALANTVMAGIKQHAWNKKSDFRMKYDELFKAPKYVQMELGI